MVMRLLEMGRELIDQVSLDLTLAILFKKKSLKVRESNYIN